ncbi:MAG: hypothetical protein JNJ71_06340 [Rubrivivax sp.]|nr:hypothetical protein [Rubrivivax sp.]
MWVRILVVAMALIVGLPLAWRLIQSPEVQAWWSPVAAEPSRFRFDNGSVRQPPAPASGPLVDVSPGLKKCRQGERVIYTDAVCPPGTQPVLMAGGTVNVVKGSKVEPAPAPGSASGAAAGKGRPPHVRDLLNDGSPSLREQHMERVMQQQR